MTVSFWIPLLNMKPEFRLMYLRIIIGIRINFSSLNINSSLLGNVKHIPLCRCSFISVLKYDSMRTKLLPIFGILFCSGKISLNLARISGAWSISGYPVQFLFVKILFQPKNLVFITTLWTTSEWENSYTAYNQKATTWFQANCLQKYGKFPTKCDKY